MSEYQYYGFLALDRPLDERQLREVDALSSRAEVSTTRWVNTYNYGSFRGDETRFVTDYFDAMIYVANWGTRRFSVGLPADRVDDEQILLHATGDALSAELVTGKVVVDFCSETEDRDGWEDGSGWMATLAPVRRRLLGGDTRPLYLGWLLGLQMGDLDDGDVEPPVPDGLGDLPADLEALADFLRLDEDLLATAAERSGELADRPEGLAAWIAELPGDERTAVVATPLIRSARFLAAPSATPLGDSRDAARRGWAWRRCGRPGPAPSEACRRRSGSAVPAPGEAGPR